MKTSAALCVLAVGLLAGCSSVVGGDAEPYAGNPDSSYPCGLVDVVAIEGAVGASTGHRVFGGPLCEWEVDGPSGSVDALFAWFMNGSLDRERRTDSMLGYATSDTKVTFLHAIDIRSPNDVDSCGTATGTDSGVVQWWLHFRPAASHVDACAAAHVLSADTLNLEP